MLPQSPPRPEPPPPAQPSGLWLSIDSDLADALRRAAELSGRTEDDLIEEALRARCP